MACGHQSEVEEGIPGQRESFQREACLLGGELGEPRREVGQAEGTRLCRRAVDTIYALGPVLTTCGQQWDHPANEETGAPSTGVGAHGAREGGGLGLSPVWHQ